MFVLLVTAEYESIPMSLNTGVTAFLLWLLTWIAGEVTIVLSETYLLAFLFSDSLSRDPHFCQKHEKTGRKMMGKCKTIFKQVMEMFTELSKS